MARKGFLDVAGHEMTHGVISTTAGLIYMGESGAVNEALADFFGEAIEGDGDWIMGDEIFVDPTTAKKGGLLSRHKKNTVLSFNTGRSSGATPVSLVCTKPSRLENSVS